MYIKVRRGVARGSRKGGTMLGRGGGTRRKMLCVERDSSHMCGLWMVKDRRHSIDRTCEIGEIVELKEGDSNGVMLGERKLTRMSRGMELRSVLDMSDVVRRMSEMNVGDEICIISSKYIRSGGMYGVVVDKNAIFQRGKKGRVSRTLTRGVYLSGSDLDGKIVVRLRGRRLKEFDEDWTVRSGRMSSTCKKSIRDGVYNVNRIRVKLSAGEMRRRGFRPKVRMKAKNAIDRRYSFKKGLLTSL